MTAFRYLRYFLLANFVTLHLVVRHPADQGSAWGAGAR